MKNTIIKQLIKEDSNDGEKPATNSAVGSDLPETIPEAVEETTEEGEYVPVTNEEEGEMQEDEIEDEMPVTAESRDIGCRTQDNEMAEDSIKEPMKNVADDAHALPPNKPVIMDRRKTMEYSPSFQGWAQKLCNT